MKKVICIMILLSGCASDKYLTIQDVMPIIEAHNAVVKCMEKSNTHEEMRLCVAPKQKDGKK